MKEDGHEGVCYEDLEFLDQLGELTCELCLEIVGMLLLKGVSYIQCGHHRECSSLGTLKDHACPFAAEIHGNFDEICNCCSSCEQECSMDI